MIKTARITSKNDQKNKNKNGVNVLKKKKLNNLRIKPCTTDTGFKGMGIPRFSLSWASWMLGESIIGHIHYEEQLTVWWLHCWQIIIATWMTVLLPSFLWLFQAITIECAALLYTLDRPIMIATASVHWILCQGEQEETTVKQKFG